MKMLIVDDDKVTRELLKEIFEKEGYFPELAASGEEAIQKIKKESYPIVISDIRMFSVSGLDLLNQIMVHDARTVVILMTGFGTMEGAIQAIQKGAFDYISKPFKMDELKAIVLRAKEHWNSLQVPRSNQGATENPAERKLIGKSPQIIEVYKTVARASMATSHVLIVGESGTGKEMVARGIHENSFRREKKFVAINCGALSENLLESEIFGHMKGAFTGAIANKKGLFEEADGGTLFLDEIGDMPLPLQVKLLRVLQEGEFKPVGSNETHKADVRVIAATHVNLEEAVKAGTFREDLYYRLKVILIELPALRDRLMDLPDLIEHFLRRFSAATKKNVSHLSEESMKLLMNYSWPGNVRELENAIERAVAMTRTTVLYPEDFPSEMAQASLMKQGQGGIQSSDSLEEVERAHIMKVLEEANFNKSKAAQKLGIDRKTLHRKAERYKIDLSRRGN
jgi:DNA-binding NtrC family response regulator